MNVQQAKALQKCFEKFHVDSGHHSFSHAFLVGVANHWVTIIVNKIGDKLEMFLLDSRNRPILNANQQQLKSIATNYYDSRERQGDVIDHRPWREQMLVMSMEDTQFAVDTIWRCCCGQTSFLAIYSNLIIQPVLEGYEDYFKTTEKVTPSSINTWLSKQMPASSVLGLAERLRDFDGATVLNIDSREKMLTWVVSIQSVLKPCRNQALLCIHRMQLFCSAMEIFHDLFVVSAPKVSSKKTNQK